MQFQFTRTHAILAAVVVALLVIVFSIVGTFSSVKNEGIDRETALSAQYRANQVELSKFVSGFYEILGVADRKSEKVEEILIGAVTGRYVGDTTANPGGGELFSAITEAYPDLSQLDVYDRVVDYIASNRQTFADQQEKLSDMLGRYDAFLNKGLVRPMVVGALGFPRETLKAQSGEQLLTGEAALTQMQRMVLTDAAVDAYESGTMDPLTVDPAK